MKLLGKGILFLLLLWLLNLLYRKTAWIPFLDAEAEQYLQVRKIGKCDVIYVSESSNFPPANISERESRKISQFVSDYYPGLLFEAINKPASHAGIYRRLLDIMPDDNEVQTVVVTMNLRSFGPSWINSELETPLNKANTMYNNLPPLFDRFLVSLNAYDDASPVKRQEALMAEWHRNTLPLSEPKNSVTGWCAVEKWGDWRSPKRQLADQFIKQYAFVIDAKNPRVKDFDALAAMAKERGWNMVFNILAENVEKADSLAGPELVGIMENNVHWLETRYSAQGITVLNNLEALGSSHFTDKDFPTEHYDEQGRKTIARNVALCIRTFHRSQFRVPDRDTLSITFTP